MHWSGRLLITQLEDDLEELAASYKAHDLEQRSATTDYKRRREAARASYVSASESFAQLQRAHDDGTLTPAMLDAFTKLAASVPFELATDYQQDKLTPSWNKSPQPGPTYFFPKKTNYVHILCSPSLGDTTGDSRFSRNHVYIREDTAGGSKNSNDTTSTVFDLLLGARNPSCRTPQLYRRGHNKHGVILKGEPGYVRDIIQAL